MQPAKFQFACKAEDKLKISGWHFLLLIRWRNNWRPITVGKSSLALHHYVRGENWRWKFIKFEWKLCIKLFWFCMQHLSFFPSHLWFSWVFRHKWLVTRPGMLFFFHFAVSKTNVFQIDFTNYTFRFVVPFPRLINNTFCEDNLLLMDVSVSISLVIS